MLYAIRGPRRMLSVLLAGGALLLPMSALAAEQQLEPAAATWKASPKFAKDNDARTNPSGAACD